MIPARAGASVQPDLRHYQLGPARLQGLRGRFAASGAHRLLPAPDSPAPAEALRDPGHQPAPAGRGPAIGAGRFARSLAPLAHPKRPMPMKSRLKGSPGGPQKEQPPAQEGLTGGGLRAKAVSWALCLLFLASCASTSNKPVADQGPEAFRPEVREFVIGPGDELDIQVYRHDDLRQRLRVHPDGRISFPLIGPVEASGVSIFDLQEEITRRLTQYIVNPQVSVSIIAIRSQKIFVLGEVKTPGVFSLDRPMSVVEALSAAGGFTPDAQQGNVLLIRGGNRAIPLDVRAALKSGAVKDVNLSLESNDVIYVPSMLIADVARFMRHLEAILRPIVLSETAIILAPAAWDAIRGKTEDEQVRTIIPPGPIITPAP